MAVIEGDAVTSRVELDDRVNRLASGLVALGTEPGERAAWCGPNSTEVVVAMLACRALDLVAVPVPYRFTPEELHHVLADSGASVVMVDPAYASTIVGLLPRLPAVRHVVTFGDELPAASGPLAAGAGGKVMLYTSGTTGRPKGAVRAPSDPATLGAMMAELDFGSDEVHLVTGPLYHAGPHAFALLALRTGGTVVVARSFDAAEWVRLVGRHRVTSAFVAPIHLKRIVALPAGVLASVDLSSLRTVVVNAAPVPYALKEEVIAKLGAGFLYEVYGSTELGIVTVLRPEDQLRKPGSCGRPYGGIGLRVVDDDGSELPAGREGELFVRTPHAMEGYRGSVAPMAELPGDPGWKSVGDIGRLDHEGYVHICDRRTDMVITGGMNVYPAEVEAVLHSHPEVADAAVFGLPDDEWGERVHAVVAPRPGCALDPAALGDFAAVRLAGFKCPRSWEVRDVLPRTESGKLLKRTLRAEAV